MRYFGEYKLKDGTKASYVVEASNMELATKFIQRISTNVLAGYLNGKFMVNTSMQVSIDKWKPATKVITSASAKNFIVFGTIQGVPFSTEVGAYGEKTAYNNLTQGTMKNLNTGDLIVIYNTNQIEKKKSSALEAQKAIESSQRLARTIQSGKEAARKIPALGTALEDLFIATEMVTDWKRGVYKDVPMSTIVSVTGALIYLISPIDIIPDVVPGFGVLDDVAVVTLCLNAVHSDIRKYENWKNSQNDVYIEME